MKIKLRCWSYDVMFSYLVILFVKSGNVLIESYFLIFRSLLSCNYILVFPFCILRICFSLLFLARSTINHSIHIPTNTFFYYLITLCRHKKMSTKEFNIFKKKAVKFKAYDNQLFCWNSKNVSMHWVVDNPIKCQTIF